MLKLDIGDPVVVDAAMTYNIATVEQYTINMYTIKIKTPVGIVLVPKSELRLATCLDIMEDICMTG